MPSNVRTLVFSHYHVTGDPLPTRARTAEYFLRRCDANEYHSQRIPDQRAEVSIRVHTIGHA